MVAIFDGLGIARGYAVDLPKGGIGVYTASVFPKDLAAQRIVHLDQYSGRPLVDLRVAHYGVARARSSGASTSTRGRSSGSRTVRCSRPASRSC